MFEIEFYVQSKTSDPAEYNGIMFDNHANAQTFVSLLLKCPEIKILVIKDCTKQVWDESTGTYIGEAEFFAAHEEIEEFLTRP